MRRSRLPHSLSRIAGRDDVEVEVHPGGGHAFDNYLAPMFHRPQAAEPAWRQTIDFLRRRYPA